MHVLEIECGPEEKDRLVAELWERGTAGVIEQDLPGGGCFLRAFFDRPVSELSGRWREERDRDWVAVAQSQWEPVAVGERLFLVPAWRGDPAPQGRVRLEMQPGLACGSGWHPATQLALQGLERWLAPGSAVLDLGTGSGLLAVAAVRLGAGRVCACDIDAAAVAVAAARFRQEQIEVELFAGSLRSLRDAAFDLLVANLNAAALLELAADIRRVLRARGAAVLAGFPRRHLARVQPAFTNTLEVLDLQDWAALVIRQS